MKRPRREYHRGRRSILLADFRTVFFGKIQDHNTGNENSFPTRACADSRRRFFCTLDKLFLQPDPWFLLNLNQISRSLTLATAYAQYVVRSIGICCKHFTGNVVFQLDPRHRFVGTFRHRRERPVRRLVASTIMPEVLISSSSDGSKKLPRNKRLQDIDLEMRLDPGSNRPENFGRIENIDIVIEHEDILGVVEGQRGGGGACRDRLPTSSSSR